VAAVVIALGAGSIGGFVGYAMHGDNASASSGLQATSNGGTGTAPVVDRSSLASIAAAVQPTVVDIVVANSDEGSGVVFSPDGYIVTNNHVVAPSQGGDVTVTFNSGKKLPGSIVGTDSKTDLAVIKVNATGLTAATFGDSDKVQVGDTVLAIGSPLGLQSTVTAGIISAMHRTITEGGDQSDPFSAPTAQVTIGDALQTDAAINPGNSGGALVDTSGHVIGINSAIATAGSNGNVGVGFAISANKAKAVAQQLIKGEKVSHPFLGVSIADAANGGALIQQITAGGPAQKAGLQVGDVVTKVNDRAISNSQDLVGAIQGSSVGAQLTITYLRNGNQATTTVTVGEA
jgi:putative serine protease PepD